MNVTRALKILEPFLGSVTVSAHTDGNAWVVWAEVEDYKRPLTQFTEPFSAAQWVNEFDRRRS